MQLLLSTARLSGIGLHTGAKVHLAIHPAPVGTGFVFRRTDLAGSPEFRASPTLVSDTRRGTSLTQGAAQVHTVEHLISALAGLRIWDCTIEVDGPEIPILDGSAAQFVEALLAAGVREGPRFPDPLRVLRPGKWTLGSSQIEVFPHDSLEVTCTSSDDRGFHNQTLTVCLDPTDYVREIANARTFTFYEDIAPLLASGKIKGGSLDCAIVIKDGVPQAVGGLRFPDEFVRHKILDLLGDLTLGARPLCARIVATRPGHGINNLVAREIENLTLG